MQYLGFFLIALALVAIGVAAFKFMQVKKLSTSKLSKTGELAGNPALAGPKGDCSVEGNVVVQQPLVAPCSGKPAIYYEIVVKRKWEKYVTTEDGQKKETGSETVSTVKQAASFTVDDGSGPIAIDARQDVDADTVQSFKQEQKGVIGQIMFGQFTANVPPGGDKHTTAVEVIETILPPEGKLFVMGKLAGGQITKADGMLGKLTLSTKGKEGHIAHVKKHGIIGAVAGVVMLGGGIPIAAFADPPAPSVCETMKDAMKKGDKCTDRVTNDEGEKKTWKVTKPGGYKLSVVGTGKNSSMRLWPKVTVSKGDKDVAEELSSGETVIDQCFDKGTYSIQIRDTTKGHVGGTIKGGAGFALEITESKSADCADMKAKGGDDDDGDKKKKKGDDDDDKKKGDDDDKDTKKAKKGDDDDKGGAAAKVDTGISACDDYIAFYQKCMAKAGTPAASVKMGVDAMVKGYKAASGSAPAKKATGDMCTKSMDTLKKAGTCPGVK
ncbi:MAG: GIDE domain-containing protein [Polyangiales bacterium]